MKTKVNIIAGFLGSGKTTFILRALEKLAGKEKVAVLVNEFGKIGVDGTIMRRDNIDIMEIAQGCICCSLRSDLQNGLLEICRSVKPGRLIIEPSGVASPTEILAVLAEASLEPLLELESLTVVVDLPNFIKCVTDLGDYYYKSVQAAQVIILNKKDLSSEAEIEGIKSIVGKINPVAKVIVTSFGETPLDEIFSPQPTVPQTNYESDHHLSFQSVSEVDQESIFSRTAVMDLFNRIGDAQFGSIVRAKGVFQTNDGFLLCEYIFGQLNFSEVAAKDSRWSVIGLHLNEELIADTLRLCRLQ